MVGRFFKRLSVVIGSLVGMALLSGLAGVLVVALCMPALAFVKIGATAAENSVKPTALTDGIIPLSQKTTIYAKRDGKDVTLASFYDQNRILLKQGELSKTVINATLGAEDIRYFQHGGIDPQSLARAVATNGGAGGGSTIEMQYVKNVCVQKAELLPTKAEVDKAYHACVEVSKSRKISDIRNAIALSKKYTKDEILLAYLNIVGFGGRVYGIEAAARYYYGVHSDKLTDAQAASLISIVNNPGKLRIDEKANIAANKVRRDYVLANEYKHDLITKDAYEKAIKSEVKPKITQSPTGCMQAGNAGFFCDYVVNELLTNPVFGRTAEARYLNLQTGGLQVHTTLDMSLQQTARAAVKQYVPATSPAFKIGGAASSIQVGTGRILAMTQNKTYNNTGSATRAQTSVNYNAGYNSNGFQPGSTYKVFTLLDWIEKGHSINETVNGNARTIPANDFAHCGAPYVGSPWKFGNDEGEAGSRTVLRGTQGSVNGVFASMAEQLDLCDIRAMAQRFGVEASDGLPLQDNPPSVIGGASSVPPMLMTAAYAGVANNGVYCSPIAIDSITRLDGTKVKVPSANCHRVIDKAVVKEAKVALHAVITGGTAAGDQTSDGYYEFAKTGTTDRAVQTWIMGSTKKVTTGVWVGNVSGQVSLRQIGSTPYCALKGSTQAAIERHCIWRAIQTKANSIYGG